MFGWSEDSGTKADNFIFLNRKPDKFHLPGFLFPRKESSTVMGINSEIIHGHDLLCVERFLDATKHMIVFDIHSPNSTYGEKGQRVRLFLNEEEYFLAEDAHRRREIKILKHYAIIEGHIIPEKRRRRRNARK